MGTWVVAYDVTLNRRRAKIAKLLEARGIRLQKSVFLVEGPPRNVRRLVRELAALIDDATDRVCAWPLVPSWQDEQLCFPAEAAPCKKPM
jgi:CRISPR-associated endonuclease Cas2